MKRFPELFLFASFLFCGLSGEVCAEAEPKPVTLVAYNLKNYLAMDRRIQGEIVENAPKPESEILPLIDGLANIRPDILSVSEIGDASFVEDLQDRLEERGIDLPHTELVTAASGHNRNLALLSRFPIVEKNSRNDYTYVLDGKTLPFQRGVLDVTVALSPEYRLRCIGLHFKSKRDVPEADEALMRLNEARIAREHIDAVFKADPGVNLIVSGDLNDLRIEPPVKTIQGRFGRDDYLASLTLKDQYGFRWTYHWSFADLYSRIDFVLYSKGIAREILRDESFIHHWDNWDRASDHRPLVVKISPIDR